LPDLRLEGGQRQPLNRTARRRRAYLRDCWGECPKNRLIRTPDGEPGLNYLCAGFKRFFKHALPEVDRIAAVLRREPGS
jgi:uncharacterized protein